MRFGTILYEGVPRLVAAADEHTPRLIEGFRDILALMDAPRTAIERAYAAGTPLPDSGWRWLPPVPNPSKIIAIGLNYADHCRETGQAVPEKPLIFAKLTSSLIGHDDVIEWDPSITNRVDYEAELAVVIGKQTRLVSEENALAQVFGYTIANDVTARDLQQSDGQWTRAKGMDTFCPLGPWLVSADEIPDPQNLAVRCTVNGELRQNSSTREMIFSVKTLISYLSRVFTLYRGDIILTGTPAGVGNAMQPPRLLSDKASVTVEIEKLGRLENICRELTFRVR
ncbi:MAG: fumarylacetoacetate hydrolase [Candidatus Thermofonsia Clade 1 bacterium]|uniref:Fumarylacetoacetate hydrolase n=1 Tax=Candidatus Thermofonsia Clade 1 bacterium TaxID=2364210 RepID=A0A2M8PI82_9CHLR|nr:MAG: fumarylacetoacetate hydrolase [Candidatus Thermofonsia Clade 1 bacterium]RMF52285.1 MAG: FAA hydrolase family protein [Chloroflexota bacterium]